MSSLFDFLEKGRSLAFVLLWMMVCVPPGAQTTWLMSKANFLWKRPGS